MPVLTSEIWLPRPRDEVYAFFNDPRNLKEVSPPWLHLRTLPPMPRELRKGAIIAYVVRVRGVPVLWVSRVTRHDPPHGFTDRQLVGPYLRWVHEHTLVAEDGGTRVRERVEYRHAGGPWIERRIVRPDVERIFEYRREALRRRFPATG